MGKQDTANLAEPRARALFRRHWPWLIPVAALIAFLSRMVLVGDGLTLDWSNSLWLVWRQGRNIAAAHAPSLFVSSEGLGAFYPHFAFYGGTLYTLTGGFSGLFGHSATAAFIGSWALGFAMAYGGATWLSIQCGLRGWRAQVPGLFLVTSAYFVTNAYGRGAWGEFIATSAIPLMVAAGYHLVRHRLTPLPLLAFVGSLLLFTGSHNITLLWGVLFLALVGIALACAHRTRSGSDLTWRAARLAVVAALVVGVNLWFLFPDLAYGGRSYFAQLQTDPFYYDIHAGTADPWVLFHPLRVSTDLPQYGYSSRVYVQLPVIALAWLVVALAAGWRGLRRSYRRSAAALLAATLPFLVLLVAEAPWRVLPRTLRFVQFSYRLNSYVLLGAAGLLIIALRGLEQLPKPRRTWFAATLLAVLAFGSVLAVWQVWHPPVVLKDRNELFASEGGLPSTWNDPGPYRNYSRDDKVYRTKRLVSISPTSPEGFSGELELPEGPAPIATNIAAGDYLVDVDGLVPIGRDPAGFMVVRRPRERPTGPVDVTIERTRSGPVLIGRWLSALSLLALTGVIGWTIVRAVRTRRVTVGSVFNGPSRRARRSRGR